MTNPFQLIDLNNIQDDQLRGHVWASILEFSMQANTSQFRYDIDLVLKKLVDELVSIQSERDGDILIDSVLCYTLRVADMRGNNPKECLETIAREFDEKNRSKIMTVADRLEEIGFDKGREEGETRKAQKTALKMLKKEIDIDTISEITELSVNEIKKLKAENQEDFDSKE